MPTAEELTPGRLVIAAPHSGSGKTTLTLGIMAALAARGLEVAPFKVGPDFIDPGYHRLATGTHSLNLDCWMCGREFVRDSFARRARRADLAVIEGAMGLFDGIDGVSEAGSTAEVAKLLGAPVILVVDAKSQARSVAALLYGFAGFDPELNLAGVIFNNVASANHGAILREAVAARLPGVAVIGCFAKDPELAIPSRHLGLVTAEDNPLSGEYLAKLVAAVERQLDLDALLKIAAGACAAGLPAESGTAGLPAEASAKAGGDGSPPSPGGRGGGDLEEACTHVGGAAAVQRPVRIALASDAAFCFVYQDNLRLLEEQGAELCRFSPLSDDALPEGCAGIYLPGGYPELFAQRLAANVALLAAIRGAVEGGMPVYAECGGFIYLTRGLRAAEGEYGFAGIFPVWTTMLPRRKALGYREVELLDDAVIGGQGTTARGHEFHYSETEPMPEAVPRLYRVNRKGIVLGEEGYRYRNCLASYVHLHFGSSPAIASSFVGHCSNYMTRSTT